MQTSAAAPLKPTVDEIQLIAIDKIKPSPFNARKEFPKEYIAELAASLARDGQQTPVKVRPHNGGFQLVFGECRWRASTLAGFKELKAIVEPMDDAKAEHLCLIENLKRKDLTVFEEAEKLKRLHEVHKVKVEDLAVQVGISVRGVYEALKLAMAAPEVRNAVSAELNALPISHAKLIARLPKADQVKLVKEVMNEADYNGIITHKGLEEEIREKYLVDLRQAPFALTLKGFKCVAETCAVCPKNARNAKDEFPELKGTDTCTSPEDYRKKTEQYSTAVVADALKAGQKVLSEQEAERALRNDVGGEYVPLTRETWVGNERKTFKEMLPKKAELKTALAVDDEGNAVEVVKRSELQEVLKKAGKEKIANSYELTGRHSSSGGGGNPANEEQAKRRKKLLGRRAVAALAIEALADHQHTTAGDDVFVKLLGLGLTQGRIDNDGLQLMLKQWYGSEKKTDYGPTAAGKLLEVAKGVELRRTMVRVAMAGGLTAGGTWSDSHASELLGALKLYGLKIERFQEAAKKVKEAAAKPTPAHKKVTFADGSHHKKATQADPLDSPAVVKAKAKKAAAKAKKGGAR